MQLVAVENLVFEAAWRAAHGHALTEQSPARVFMPDLLDDPDSRARVAKFVPRKRIGTPEDVAGAVIYLSSRAGAWLTGVLIPVDGRLSTHG